MARCRIALPALSVAELPLSQAHDAMPLTLLLLAPVPPSPLPTDLEVTAVATAPAEAPAGEVASVTCRVAWSNAWRDDRNDGEVKAALADLRAAATEGKNVMPASIACAKAGVTTGEWAGEMRNVYGEYRGPTGVSKSVSNKTEGLDDIRDAVNAVSDKLGRRLKFLVGKPGLDGHSNGAEQIAARARDCGMDIDYEGIRLTPDEIVEAAANNKAHVIGLSILSGSHIPLVRDVVGKLRAAGLGHIPVIAGGIIPDDDAAELKAMGVAKVYTPKDFELNKIMGDIVTVGDPRSVAAE